MQGEMEGNPGPHEDQFLIVIVDFLLLSLLVLRKI
jgi:hypothetical protein